MHIRLAQYDDIPAILEISNWAAAHTPANFAIKAESLESWQLSFDHTHAMYPWLVACESAVDEVTGTILGFAKASPHRGRCAYAFTAEVSVYIHPSHHGKRVGTALYRALIPMLKDQGYTTLLAGITTPNPASQRLHESFGFRRVAAYSKVGWKFGKWHDVGYWQLMLRDGDDPPAPLRSVEQLTG